VKLQWHTQMVAGSYGVCLSREAKRYMRVRVKAVVAGSGKRSGRWGSRQEEVARRQAGWRYEKWPVGRWQRGTAVCGSAAGAEVWC